jgi:AcrR family transcriptional regulator
MCQPDTKQRVLNAAEHLFAEHGYYATSLRTITTRAGVNLAAVSYHFGGKEALIEAVIVRRLEPLNRLRSERLDDVLEQAARANRRPSCRDLLRAFVEPTLHLRREGSGSEDFIALVGRTLAEPRGVVMNLFMQQMEPLMKKYFEALKLALPQVRDTTLFLRLHLLMGSLSHIMRCHERYPIVPHGVCADLPVEELVEHYLDFATAGMEAAQ